MTSLILGTRGSELALTQTEMTRAALAAAWPELDVQQRIIKTSGDLRPDLKLAEFQSGDQPLVDKGIFTKELEEALQAGTIDAAVHSLKDVPTVLGDGFRIAAVLPRAPVEDVLITKHPGGLAALPAGAVVATSSVRRAKQLQSLRPDVSVRDIRGNVATRIRKVADDAGCAALILAKAGLVRLGLFQPVLTGFAVPLHCVVLEPSEFLPAASQGAVAIETFGVNDARNRLLRAVNDTETMQRVGAERHFLKLLEAGCQTPVGVHSWIKAGTLTMKAVVFAEDSGPSLPVHGVLESRTRRRLQTAVTLRGTASGDATGPDEVALALFRSLRAHPSAAPRE